jgi:hypothetical protein
MPTIQKSFVLEKTMMIRREFFLGVIATLLVVGLVRAADQKDPEKKSGTIVGEITSKGKDFVEVKADGEEQARKYVPHWVGGLPKDGGGPDKEMLKVIADLKVGSRVKLFWEFEERPRVVKVEVLKAPKDK